MNDLIEKIQNARNHSCTIGNFTFHYTRPTGQQAADMYKEFGDSINYIELCLRFVTGWEGVNESDCVKDGAMSPVAWSEELWHEWIVDQLDLWSPLGQEIVDKYLGHEQAMSEAGKV